MALIDYFNDEPNSYVTMSSSSRWTAQSFKASSSYDIAIVKVRLFASGSPGIVTVSLRAATGDTPTGSDLASGVTNGDTLTTDTTGEIREITFGASYSLTSGTKYTIVVRPSAGILGWVGRNSSPTYANGDNSFSFNSGVTWSSHAGVEDHWFETYSAEGLSYVNIAGTVAGVSTTTGTLAASAGIDPPSVTYWYLTGSYYYRLLVQSDGTYGDPPPTGTENVDYEILSGYLPNFINTNRRLVAAARNSIYYENI